MTSITKVFLKPVVVLLLLTVMLSCSIETRLGRSFADAAPRVSVLVLEPDNILLSDIRDEGKDSTGALLFPYEVDRSAITAAFTDALKKELSAYGLKVYSSARIDTFMTLSPPAFLFNTAQAEMEAFIYRFRDKLTTDSAIYTQDLLLNAVNFNTWFEFTELNSENVPEVLFSNFYIKDAIDGDFRENLLSGEVSYLYRRTDIDSADMLTLAAYAGQTNARYIYNFLLNRYMRDKLPDNTSPALFYFYDRDKGKVLVLENYAEFRKISR